MNVVSVNKSIVNIALAHIFKQFEGVNFHFHENIQETFFQNDNTLLIIGKSMLNDTQFKAFNQNLIKYLVFLDESYDRNYINKALEYKTLGFITLDMSEKNIIECLNAFENNVLYLPIQVTQLLMENIVKINRFELTTRETEILDLLAKGKTLQEMGDTLFLSKNTVVTHKRNILKKTGFNKMTQLIAWWINN